MLSGYEILLFGCVGLFILCAAIWLVVQLITYVTEIIGMFMKKYFPQKYYYDWEDGLD